MAELTNEGLRIKRLNEIINDRVSSARNLYGSDAATTVNDVLGRALRVHAASQADLEEVLEDVFNSFNPAFATGISLDRIVAYAGLTRQEASPSTVSLLVSGDYQTLIPESSFVGSSVTSHRFLTTEQIVLNSNNVSGATIEVIASQDNSDYTVTFGGATFTYTSGTGESRSVIANSLSNLIDNSNEYSATVDGRDITITFNSVFVPQNSTITSNISYRKIEKIVGSESQEIGPISQLPNTLDTIEEPIQGWDSVTNPLSAAEGRFRETDEELRIRFANSKELNARGTIDSVFSNLLGVQDVNYVQVYENVSMNTDANGLPPKSFSVVIQGGNGQRIADTIWAVKPAGIEAFGSTTIQVSDSQGISHDISFSRPSQVDIYIDVTISAAENQTFPSNVDEQIINALEDYFESTYSVGSDVIYSRLYTPINSAASGFQVDSLTIGTNPSPTGTSNITIAFDEIANLLKSNVNVTVNT